MYGDVNTKLLITTDIPGWQLSSLLIIIPKTCLYIGKVYKHDTLEKMGLQLVKLKGQALNIFRFKKICHRYKL